MRTTTRGSGRPERSRSRKAGDRLKNHAAPVTLQRTDPKGKIPGPHSRLPPPGGRLGTVPRVLAPSQEFQDEVRTSAQDRVAAPSPLRNNLSRHSQSPQTSDPDLALERDRESQAQPHTFWGRRGDLAHPAHLCSLGPGCHRRLAVPRPERIHFGLRCHDRGELLLRGIKRRGRDGDGDRGGRAGGRHGQAGLLGVGRQVTQRRAGLTLLGPSSPR